MQNRVNLIFGGIFTRKTHLSWGTLPAGLHQNS